MTAAALIEAAARLPDGKEVSLPRRRGMVEAIEARRKELGLSLEALAREACVSPSSYRRLRNGERGGKARTLRALARALGRPQMPCDIMIHALAPVLQVLAFEALKLKLVSGGLVPAKARDVAIYIAHVELGLSQKLLADMAGLSKQMICRIVRDNEERRDTLPGFEALIAAAITPSSDRVAQRVAA